MCRVRADGEDSFGCFGPNPRASKQFLSFAICPQHRILPQAPILSQQREEYARLQSEASQLASQLSQAISDRDSQAAVAQETQQKFSRSTRENALLQEQLGDLGRQIQALLKRVARLENPLIPSDAYLEENGPRPAQNVDDVITDNLVLFVSIAELQEQNQKLLKIVRELGEKLEDEEREYRTSIDREQKEAVREAHEAIQELAAQLERQRKSSETTIQAYMKERDALRSMLARAEKTAAGQPGSVAIDVDSDAYGHGTREGGDSDLVRELAETRDQFTKYKNEVGGDSRRLQEDLIDSQREIGKLSATLAKAHAKAEFLAGT
jgi:nucleoprotein TPR